MGWNYAGTAWDDAATTWYAAMASQTTFYSNSVLSAFSTDVVGACTKFVDAGVLSSVEVSGAGAAVIATPAASGLSSGSGTAMRTSSTSSASLGANAGINSSVKTASNAKSGGVGKKLNDCGLLLKAVLVWFRVVASLYYYLS